jgi:hypothetical protein
MSTDELLSEVLRLPRHDRVRAAAIWYDEREQGLGDRFVSEVASALARIGEAPRSSPIWVESQAF